jgi:hypothetical protein
VVAADRTGLFQGSQAAVAGREAEADAPGQFGNGQAPVLLQFSKNLPIQCIHVGNSSSAGLVTLRSWKHISLVSS